ncbi:HD domain-containing protein [Candidatus Woesearchaeota archaeon]|nr:HD domain-containing protein [Candidatus Woesearchaeota archaeon]
MNIPIKKNKKLGKIIKKVENHTRLNTLWDCSNVMVMDRQGFSDHGPVHVAIVANIALKLLRNLIQSEISPSIVKEYSFDNNDAEIVVVLGSVLHDIGNAVHRYDHERTSVYLSNKILEELLEGVYKQKEMQIMICEILHTIICHDGGDIVTIEAGVIKLADALDMKQGRARIPFERGIQDIYSVSAMAINEVNIHKNKHKPISIEIELGNSAGIFQIDNLLKNKLKDSPIERYVEVIAKVKEGKEKKIIRKYELKND